MAYAVVSNVTFTDRCLDTGAWLTDLMPERPKRVLKARNNRSMTPKTIHKIVNMAGSFQNLDPSVYNTIMEQTMVFNGREVVDDYPFYPIRGMGRQDCIVNTLIANYVFKQNSDGKIASNYWFDWIRDNGIVIRKYANIVEAGDFPYVHMKQDWFKCTEKSLVLLTKLTLRAACYAVVSKDKFRLRQTFAETHPISIRFLDGGSFKLDNWYYEGMTAVNFLKKVTSELPAHMRNTAGEERVLFLSWGEETLIDPFATLFSKRYVKWCTDTHRELTLFAYFGRSVKLTHPPPHLPTAADYGNGKRLGECTVCKQMVFDTQNRRTTNPGRPFADEMNNYGDFAYRHFRCDDGPDPFPSNFPSAALMFAKKMFKEAHLPRLGPITDLLKVKDPLRRGFNG